MRDNLAKRTLLPKMTHRQSTSDKPDPASSGTAKTTIARVTRFRATSPFRSPRLPSPPTGCVPQHINHTARRVAFGGFSARLRMRNADLADLGRPRVGDIPDYPHVIGAGKYPLHIVDRIDERPLVP